MKITFDTKTNSIKVGGKSINEASEFNKSEAERYIRQYILDNTKLSDYEEDSMWMSYRYCIGRHTIASHMHASDIWKNCRNRMSKEREIFTAYDINREIEMSMPFRYPMFNFPITSLNRIYSTAVDIVCQFMEDYNIKSKEDFLKYREVDIILSDNPQGYKLEVMTWEEYLRPQVHKIIKDWFAGQNISEDRAWEFYEAWKKDPNSQKEFDEQFKEISKNIPDADCFYDFSDFEDLFVWNDLAHCFDHEHHHESILVDGTQCKWFWSWDNKTELHDDGYYYRSFGYQRIRVPLDNWNSSYTVCIPDSSIKEDLY